MSREPALQSLRAEIALDWSRIVIEMRAERSRALDPRVKSAARHDENEAMAYIVGLAQSIEADAPPSMAALPEIIGRVDPLTYPYRSR